MSFLSYAQNGEDVVLHRALADVENGCYVEVGANDPEVYSISRSFYEIGWRGLCIEPMPEYASRFPTERPWDTLFEGVIGPTGRATLHNIPGTGLSSLDAGIAEEHAGHGYAVIDIEVPAIGLDELLEREGFAGRDIHFMTIDTEGSEAQVLGTLGLERFRPWILVIEATQPMSTTPSHESWEANVLGAGYRFCLFDGLSRFYVDERLHAELVSLVSYPVCIFDDFETVDARRAHEELEQLRSAQHEFDDELEHVRDERDRATSAAIAANQELARVRSTLSWRVTAPLRGVRRHVR